MAYDAADGRFVVLLGQVDPMTTEYPIYIDGAFVRSGKELTVTNPFDGSPVGTTWLADPDDLDRATRAAEVAFKSFGKTPVFERVELLKALAAKLKQRRTDVIDIIVREAGKPVGEATTEVDRGRLHDRDRCRRGEADPGRCHPTRPPAILEGAVRDRSPVSGRTDRRNLAIQLSTQPGAA